MRRTFHWTNIKSRCCCSAPAVRLSDVTRITVIFNQHCFVGVADTAACAHVCCGFRSGTAARAPVVRELSWQQRLARGCDSGVGGILPQIRGESLVFGETEGELKRERDLGYSSENGVSISVMFFCATATECRKMRGAALCCRHCTEKSDHFSIYFCAVINEGQPLLGSCSG